MGEGGPNGPLDRAGGRGVVGGAWPPSRPVLGPARPREEVRGVWLVLGTGPAVNRVLAVVRNWG